MTLFYLGSWEEKVVGFQDGRTKWKGGSESTIIKLERFLVKLSEEKKQMLATLRVQGSKLKLAGQVGKRGTNTSWSAR